MSFFFLFFSYVGVDWLWGKVLLASIGGWRQRAECKGAASAEVSALIRTAVLAGLRVSTKCPVFYMSEAD